MKILWVQLDLKHLTDICGIRVVVSNKDTMQRADPAIENCRTIALKTLIVSGLQS